MENNPTPTQTSRADFIKIVALEKNNPDDATADDVLKLPYELRQKSRQRVRLDSGREAGLFLPRGSILRSGDFLITEEGLRFKVEAAAERVSIVRTKDALMQIRVAYHLGNRHVAVQIKPNCLIYLHDHVLDDMVRQLGGSVMGADQAFEPEEGAYHGGAHHHCH